MAEQHAEHVSEAVRAWVDEIERRPAARQRAVARGLTRRRLGTAAGAYRAAGRWQCAGQMDVWQCIAAVEDGEGEAAGGER